MAGGPAMSRMPCLRRAARSSRSDSFAAAHSDSQAPGMQAPSAIEFFTVLEDVIA